MSIRSVKDRLSELLRRVEAGTHLVVMRRMHPVAAVISHNDFEHFQELLRKEGLTEALLRGRGIDSTRLSTEAFLDLLDRHVRGRATTLPPGQDQESRR